MELNILPLPATSQVAGGGKRGKNRSENQKIIRFYRWKFALCIAEYDFLSEKIRKMPKKAAGRPHRNGGPSHRNGGAPKKDGERSHRNGGAPKKDGERPL